MSMNCRSKLPRGSCSIADVAHQRDVGVVDGDGEIHLIVERGRRGVLGLGRCGLHGHTEPGAHDDQTGSHGRREQRTESGGDKRS